MSLSPVILSNAGKAPSPTIAGGSPPWLMTRAQWADEDQLYVLFAVSDGDGHGPVIFDLSNSTAFSCSSSSKLIVVRVMEPDPRAATKAPLPVVNGCTFTDSIPQMAAVAYNISVQPRTTGRLKADDLQATTCALASDTAYDTLHMAGVTPVPPLKLLPGTPTVAACCSRCSAHDGCAFFTLYPNHTCALLDSFGGPRVHTGAVSGSNVVKPAPASFVVVSCRPSSLLHAA